MIAISARVIRALDRDWVLSTAINSIGYDEAEEILEIEFSSGGVYQYSGVPQYLFDEIVAVLSKGRFFHDFIRNVYDYDRVE